MQACTACRMPLRRASGANHEVGSMKLTVPTMLTLLRIVMIPVLAVVFYLPYGWTNFAAAAVFALASLTDWLDGWIARRYHQYSTFGAFLDPVADKLMVSTALFLIVQGHPKSIALIFQAIIAFIFNRVPGRFLFHVLVEAAALNHETVNDAMKNCPVVMAGFDIGKKILDGLWRLFRIEFQYEVAHSRLEQNARCIGCLHRMGGDTQRQTCKQSNKIAARTLH